MNTEQACFLLTMSMLKLYLQHKSSPSLLDGSVNSIFRLWRVDLNFTRPCLHPLILPMLRYAWTRSLSNTQYYSFADSGFFNALSYKNSILLLLLLPTDQGEDNRTKLTLEKGRRGTNSSVEGQDGGRLGQTMGVGLEE